MYFISEALTLALLEAKRLEDEGFGFAIPHLALDDIEDEFCFRAEIVNTAFDHACDIFNSDTYLDNWILQDTAMERYFDLCRLYEGRTGQGQSQYRLDATRAVDELGEVYDTNFGYIFRTDIRRKSRCALIIQYYEDWGDFFMTDTLTNTLVEIADFFRSGSNRLLEIINNFDERAFHFALPAPQKKRRRHNGR